DKSAAWNRGAYLVQGPGHCGACHTPRGVGMQEKAFDERDEQFLAGEALNGWYAPSLRGLKMSEEDLAVLLREGRSKHAALS
ncbi:cytochrome c, partial [Klebsiella pneumoniae]|nr:cytochrome c [Klebsiella pneumoniae]